MDLKKRFHRKKRKYPKYDCMIILGGGVNKDSSLPSVVEDRLELAIKLYLKGHSNNFILSGNIGSKNENKKIPEAIAMQYFLLSRRIPVKRLILEDKSKDTFENAYYCKEICKKNNFKDIILITSKFHMPRAKAIFNLFFGEDYNFLFKPAKESKTKRRKIRKRMIYEKEYLKLIQGDLFDENLLGKEKEFYKIKKSKYFQDKVKALNKKYRDYKTLY